ncbi:alpha-1,3-glucanase [Ceratobasidium sp. AG-Ba]|nr:alpha-1,3-glucanase [Ceratobasidium sp. AG-Ba]
MVCKSLVLLFLGGLMSTTSARSHSKRASAPKSVFSHFIVGNSYNFDSNMWASNIKLASSKSIDAFTLNLGPDVWQPERVKTAFDTAQQVAPNFKMSLSFDMTELPCGSAADGQSLIDKFISPIKTHPSRYLINSKMLVSTFAGQWCTFGQANPSDGWKWFLAAAGTPVYFMPNFQIDVSELASTWTWLDGYKLWNAWSLTQQDNNQWADDAWYMQHTRPGQGYLTMVSAWYFSHRPGSPNNRYYRGDNFMLTKRWKQLIQNRNSLSFVEIGSWNDYGESHYIGPLTGSIPANTLYVNSNADHTAWADLMAYYAKWFKNGNPPAITKDKVYMWARPHPKDAGICNSDGIGAVPNANWADDLLFVSVFLKASAQVSCTSGGNKSGTKTLNTGISEFSLPLSSGSVSCLIKRNGATVISYKPTAFTYTTSPSVCSMNAWTGMKSG